MPAIAELQPAQGIGDMNRTDRTSGGRPSRPRRASSTRPRVVDDVEGLPPEGRGETGSRPNRREVEPDEIDLATESRVQPSLRWAGRTGSAENVERATGQLPSGRRRSELSDGSADGLAAGPPARWRLGRPDRRPQASLWLGGTADDRRHGGSVRRGHQRQIIGRSTLRPLFWISAARRGETPAGLGQAQAGRRNP